MMNSQRPGETTTAIFCGRRYRLIRAEPAGVVLEAARGSKQFFVPVIDPDLIVSPSPDDLRLAEAFERGEINAFEYPNGHTFPPNREIVCCAEDKDKKKTRIH